MKKLFFLTGASGSGKTTAVENVQKINSDIVFFFFDNIGVPTEEVMKKDFGGPEEWQRVTTEKWVNKIVKDVLGDEVAVLDGQIRPAFIDQACEIVGVKNYEVILFDCSDEVRANRLRDRGQEHLATPDMMNWAKYLRDESVSRGYDIIDNTNFSEEETATAFLKILNQP